MLRIGIPPSRFTRIPPGAHLETSQVCEGFYMSVRVILNVNYFKEKFATIHTKHFLQEKLTNF